MVTVIDVDFLYDIGYLNKVVDTVFPNHFLYLQIIKGQTTPLMNIFKSMNHSNCFICKEEKAYVSPAIRIVSMMTEFSFLQSNIEPIIDGGEEDWD